jgi:hypothetical protein
MISTTWTEAPAGMPAAGLDVRPRAYRRAPEAFTAPFQGTGLPFGGRVVGAVVDTVAVPQTGIALLATDKFHTDATTLGIHPSRRPTS